MAGLPFGAATQEREPHLDPGDELLDLSRAEWLVARRHLEVVIEPANGPNQQAALRVARLTTDGPDRPPLRISSRESSWRPPLFCLVWAL